MPGGRAGIAYVPEEVVTVERDSLVAMLRRLIAAPGTAAPEGSKTEPWTVPVVYCA